MSSELERLLVTLDSNVAGFRDEFRQHEQTVKKHTEGMGKEMKKFQQGAAATLKRLAGPVAAIFSVNMVRRFAVEAVRAFDEIAKRASAAGISGETLQELRFAFGELAGTLDNEVDQSLRRFNRRLGLAAEGGGPARETLEDLGIAIHGVGGEMRDTEAVLDDALRALGGIENDALRAAKASQLFGEDAGPKLAAALGEGIGALETAREETVGLVGEQTQKDAEALIDAFGRMATTIKTDLGGAIVDTAGDLADFLGIIDRGVAGRLRRELEVIEERMEMIRAGIIGDPVVAADPEAALAELEARRQSILKRLKTQELITPFAERQAMRQKAAEDAGREDGEAYADGLEEVMTSGHRERTFLRTGVGAELLASMEDFRSEAENVAEDVESEFSQLGRSMGFGLESALSDAFLGIEQDFDELIKRMLVRTATSEVLNFLGGVGGPVGGAFSFLGFGRAGGGPVMQGQPVVVGERRPELFVPSSAGRVEPRVQMVSNRHGDVQIVQNIQTGLPVQLRALVQNIASEAAARTATDVLNRQRGRV